MNLLVPDVNVAIIDYVHTHNKSKQV